MELIRAIVDLKQRNAGYGCPRITQLISTVFGIEEIKMVPHIPVSYPFVEKLIGTLKREYLDQVLFLECTRFRKKLDAYKD